MQKYADSSSSSSPFQRPQERNLAPSSDIRRCLRNAQPHYKSPPAGTSTASSPQASDKEQRSARRHGGCPSPRRRSYFGISARSGLTHRRITPRRRQTEIENPSDSGPAREPPPLICTLGSGPLTSRIFVVRSPTSLDSNVVGREFAQTRTRDIRRVIEDLQRRWGDSTPVPSKCLRLPDRKPPRKRTGVPRAFWARCLIWDLSIARAGMAGGIAEFEHQVLSFRLLDIGIPSHLYVTNLCSTLLYWLTLDECNFSFVCFRESETVFLAILGCVILALDSYHLPREAIPSVPDLVTRLRESSLCPLWESSIYHEPAHVNCNAKMSQHLSSSQRRQLEAEGVMSWKPLETWNPAAARLLKSFRTFLTEDAFADGVSSKPVRLKTIFINNFPSPVEGIALEIYEVFDLQLADGRTKRRRKTRRAVVYRHASCDDTDRGDAPPTAYNITGLKKKGARGRRGSEVSSSSGDSARYEHKPRPRGTGFTAQLTRQASKLWMKTGGETSRLSSRREVQYRGCHLFGPYGISESPVQDDACLQLRLVADRSDYTVCEASDEGQSSSVVLDFTGRSVGHEQEPRSVLVSGDIVIAVRQLGCVHLASCKECRDMPRPQRGIARPRTGGSQSLSVPSLTSLRQGSTSKRAARMPSHHRGLEPGEVFALFSCHTAFLSNEGNEGTLLFELKKADFDIPAPMDELIPDDLHVCIIASPYGADDKDQNVMAGSYPQHKKKKHSSAHGMAGLWSWATSGRADHKEEDEGGSNSSSKRNSTAAVVRLEPAGPPRHQTHSHHVNAKLQLDRWLHTLIQRPYPDIFAFLRHHVVVPQAEPMETLLAEGYDDADVSVALKVANNDHWGALQFLCRFCGVPVHAGAGNLSDLVGPFNADMFQIDATFDGLDTHRSRRLSSDRHISSSFATEDAGVLDAPGSTPDSDEDQGQSISASPVPKIDEDYVRRFAGVLSDDSRSVSSVVAGSSQYAVPPPVDDELSHRECDSPVIESGHDVQTARVKRRRRDSGGAAIETVVMQRRRSIPASHYGQHTDDGQPEPPSSTAQTARYVRRPLQTTRASPVHIGASIPALTVTDTPMASKSRAQATLQRGTQDAVCARPPCMGLPAETPTDTVVHPQPHSLPSNEKRQYWDAEASALPSRFPGSPPFTAPNNSLTYVGCSSDVAGAAFSAISRFPGYPPSTAPGSQLKYTPRPQGACIIGSPATTEGRRFAFPGYPPFPAPGSQLKLSPPPLPAKPQRPTGSASRFPGVPPSPPPRSCLDGNATPEQTSQTTIPKGTQGSVGTQPVDSPIAAAIRARCIPPSSPTRGLLPAIPAGLKQAASSPSAQHKAPLGRKIFWKPLRDGHIEGTVFAEIGAKPRGVEERSVDVSALVDNDFLSRLFVKQAPEKKDLGRKAVASARKPEGKALLDPKRAQNLSIVLARLKHQPHDIARMLRDLDGSELTVEELDKIETVMLSADEDRAFAAYLTSGGPECSLRPCPEAKILPLRPSACYRPTQSINVLRLEKTLETTLADLKRDAGVLRIATEEVKSSSRFRQVLAVVLRWGNYVNHGVAGGDLYIRGFTLGSLLRLTEFKTTIDASITALHFLAANMLHAAPQLYLELLQEDMPTVALAAKISGDALTMTLDLLQKGLRLVRDELRTVTADLENSPHLAQRNAHLAAFEATAANDIEAAKVESEEIFREVYTTGRFFGDESAHQTTTFKKNFRIEGFFVTLREFLMKFNACCQDVLRHPKKYEVLLAAAAAEKQASKPDSNRSSTGGPSHAGRGVLRNPSGDLCRRSIDSQGSGSSLGGGERKGKRRASEKRLMRAVSIRSAPSPATSPCLRPRPATVTAAGASGRILKGSAALAGHATVVRSPSPKMYGLHHKTPYASEATAAQPPPRSQLQSISENNDVPYNLSD